MRRQSAAALLAISVAFGPLIAKEPARAGGVVYLAPALGIRSGQTIAEELQKPFPDTYDVTVGRGTDAVKKTVTNCAEFLGLGEGRRSTGSSLNDGSLRVLGIRCVALDWLRTAKPVAKPVFQGFSFRQITVRDVPPEMALAISGDSVSEAKAASDRGESILAMEPGVKLRARSAEESELVAADWTAGLTVYAHGDFLGDGSDELLVGWQGSATSGTYKAVKVFLLARKKHSLVVVRSRVP